MPTVEQILVNGTNDEKTALVARAEARYLPESIGFMSAVLNYRDQVNNPGQVAAITIALTRIGGAVTGANLSDAEKGLQIYNRFVPDNAGKQVNLSYDVKTALDAISRQGGTPFTPASFDDAHTEIRNLMHSQQPTLGT